MNCKLIKVCGMREAQNIHEVEALDIDLMGFIFWQHSSRYVASRPSYLPRKCKRVGVFVDETIERVLRTAEDYDLDYIQLHGKETPEYCTQLRGRRIIKALNLASIADLSQTVAYHGLIDCVLFDAKGRSAGGNGVKFDWTLLDAYTGDTPYLLSGGIGPDDAEQINAFLRRDTQAARKCIGLDLNSRFEQSPGVKDVAALRTFLQNIPR